MLGYIAIAIMALGFILLLASVVILYPMLVRERKADTEAIRAAELDAHRTSHEI
jgi:hypothetical protein